MIGLSSRRGQKSRTTMSLPLVGERSVVTLLSVSQWDEIRNGATPVFHSAI
jgi:hypothetical protein